MRYNHYCTDCGEPSKICYCIDARRKECFCHHCYQKRIDIAIKAREQIKLSKARGEIVELVSTAIRVNKIIEPKAARKKKRVI